MSLTVLASANRGQHGTWHAPQGDVTMTWGRLHSSHVLAKDSLLKNLRSVAESYSSVTVCWRKCKKKEGAEVWFEATTSENSLAIWCSYQPCFSTETSPLQSRLPLLKRVHRAKLSGYLSRNCSGSEVRSPSVVWLKALNYRVCICSPFCGA